MTKSADEAERAPKRQYSKHSNQPTNVRIGCVVLLVVGVLVFIGKIGEMNTTNNTETQDDSCRSNWTKCTDNEQLVNNYSDWPQVQGECKRTANGQARYGNPEWPRFPFQTFLKGTESGMVIAIEPDAQFSNGFGAMVHSRVECTYDLREKRVISLNVLPR